MDSAQFKPQLMAELETRLQAIYGALADGNDVAPAQRYRAQGFAQALVIVGVLSEVEFKTLLDIACQRAFNGAVPQALQSAINTTAANDGSCCIPIVMPRAPVYPSTKN